MTATLAGPPDVRHQGEGKIIDEMGKSAVFQKRTENDKQENIGRRYTDTGAQKALGAPELGNEHTLQRKSVMSQVSRQVSAEPVVRQEQGRQNGQISRSTPGCFKYADNGYKGDADFQTADASSRLGNAGIIENQVQERPCRPQNKEPVPQRRQFPTPLLLLIRRK